MLCPQRTQSERPKAWPWLWHTNLKQSSWVKDCWIWNKTFRIRYGTRFIDTDSESGIIYIISAAAKWSEMMYFYLAAESDTDCIPPSVSTVCTTWWSGRKLVRSEASRTESSAPISLANDWSVFFLACKQSFLLGLLWGSLGVSLSLPPSFPLSPRLLPPSRLLFFFFFF